MPGKPHGVCPLIAQAKESTTGHTVDPIWTPWRMDYIMGQKQPGCAFCDKLSCELDEAEHVLLRGQAAFITLNRYPYTNGHLLIVPYLHTPSLEHLPVETLTEMMLLVNRGIAALRLAMQPQGFNIGVNLGKAAGAGIEDHVHVHVVPRWYGDTSFMSTISSTRTLPETLDQSYQRLRNALEALNDQGAEGRTQQSEVLY
jgi:ATP adenylyltransferase